MYKLGIDVGGTNTDAVLLDKNFQLIDSIKVPTSSDIQQGIHSAMDSLLNKTNVNRKHITHVMLGTTQSANAIVECKRLVKVGVIRLGYPATGSIEPFTLWPKSLENAVKGDVVLIEGGYEYNGKTLTNLDEEKLCKLILQMKNKVKSFAVTSVFSCIKNDQELQVEQIIKRELGKDIGVSLSHHIGSLGLIERENATILNAALENVIGECIDGFQSAVRAQNIDEAKLYLCQNDGTLMSLEYARKFPIFTIASGLTNSIRGASYLNQQQNAIVIDVGGTTTDVGVISGGCPRESSLAVEIGGIRTNFRMPDVISVGLGGGSIVRYEDNKISVGPDSVGHRITSEALVFGGKTITTTDIAVRLGMANIGDRGKVAHLDENFAKQVLNIINAQIAHLIDKMKPSVEDIEVIIVGGGSIIIPEKVNGLNLSRPKNNFVANAIGAAIAQVSGTYEKLCNLDIMDRKMAIQEITELAKNQAVLAGAKKKSLQIAELDEIQLTYHPGNAMRIKVKVIGDLDIVL